MLPDRLVILWAAPLLVLPPLVAFAAGVRARRVATRDAAAAHFGAAQVLAWIPLATLLATLATLDTPLPRLLLRPLAGALGPAALPALGLLASVPLGLATLACALVAHRIGAELRGASTPPGRAWARAAWSWLAFAALGAGAGASAELLAGHDWGAAAGAFAGTALAFSLAQRRAAQTAGLEACAVTRGELRDRVTALAQAAKVALRHLYVIPTGALRMANAFAMRGHTVLLTDWLLAQLDRREVDAVLAHEVAHLQLGHPRKLRLAVLGSGALAGMVTPWLGWAGTLPAAMLLAVLATRFVARDFERAADARALQLGADPEAFIAALARLARVNQVPLRWGRVAGGTLTHPSTWQRAQAIGRAANLPPERVEALLGSPPEPLSHYELPAAARPGGKVFSSAWRRANVRRLNALFMAGVTAACLAAGTAAHHAGWPRPLGLVLAALAGLGALVGLQQLLSARAIARLEPALRARLAPPPGARAVTLSPGPSLRIYDGAYDWDLGWLALEPDALVYRGEEAGFRLPRGAITGVALEPGPRGWFAAPRVAVDWDDARGEPGRLLLRPLAPTAMTALAPAALALRDELERWRAERPGGPSACDPAPPRERDVTGAPAERLRGPGRLPALAIAFGVWVAIAAALTRTPFSPWTGGGAFDAWLATMVVAALQRPPARRRRTAAAAPARRAA